MLEILSFWTRNVTEWGGITPLQLQESFHKYRVAACESCKALSTRPDPRGLAGAAQSSLVPSTVEASITPQ
jgi:hypothetical protein